MQRYDEVASATPSAFWQQDTWRVSYLAIWPAGRPASQRFGTHHFREIIKILIGNIQLITEVLGIFQLR